MVVAESGRAGIVAEHPVVDRGEVVDEPARVLVVDPPWMFEDPLPGKGRGAAKHYSSLCQECLVHLPLPRLATNCVLFLWRVGAMQQEALDVVRAWGFAPKTEMVWQKMTRNGKKHFGMGRILRGLHETCIVATRGRTPPKVRNIRTTFEARVGRHSEKPEAFFRLVEALFDGPYVELFARRHRAGWRCFGDEI